MNISLGDIVVWIVVGVLAGTVAGAILTRSKKGYGHGRNLLVGLAGAIIGGLLFKLFRVDLGLGSIAVSAEDLISALLGSLLLMIIYRSVKKKRGAGGA